MPISEAEVMRRAVMKRGKRQPPAWLVDGATVNYHAILDEPATKTGLAVRGAPFKASSGHWVVFLHGVSGYVLCEAVSR